MKPTPFKKKKLLFGKQADIDDDTGSNSSADFQPSSSQRNYTPQRKSTPTPKRVTRSSTKLESKIESSDVSPGQPEVPASDKDSGSSNKTSPSLPDPPSPSLLKNLSEPDSDQVS